MTERVAQRQIREAASNRRNFLECAGRSVLLALPLILYLAIPTRNFYWDGVAFAIDIEKHLPFGSLVHPSHLLYKVWGAGLFRVVELLGIHARCLFVLQAANGVLAGLCVILLYRSLVSRKTPPSVALAGSILFAFSATWWKFATDANAYIPSILLLLCANQILEARRSPLAAGLAHAGAMLFHELAILFLPVALFRLRKDPRAMASYISAACLPVAFAYIVAYRAASKTTLSMSGFFTWITAHSSDSGFSLNLGFNVIQSVRGTARLLFGGRLGDFVRDPLAIGASVCLLLATFVFLIRLWRAAREGGTSRRPSLPEYAALWAGIYIAFLFFWMPANTFYRLFYLPPMVMVVVGRLRRAERTRNAVWAFATMLPLWNFSFVVYPQSRPDYNVALRFALAQQRKWLPGTPIVFQRFHPDLWVISYFNQQAAWISLERFNMVQLEANLEYARRVGKLLWLEETAYDLVLADPDGQRWLAVHERTDQLLYFRDAKHRFTFHCLN
jgi:hypothetical protein